MVKAHLPLAIRFPGMKLRPARRNRIYLISLDQLAKTVKKLQITDGQRLTMHFAL